jgi:murein DD-endopeptidase MepM/ murein hydrolase activator NlpD
MYEGDYRVLSAGVPGKADVTANVSFVNGMETSREIVASVTLREPITELQARGTTPRPSWYPTGSFRWPTSGVITSYFGYRDAPNAAASTNHNAIDIANGYGTPIYAADGGEVIFAGWSGSYGYLIKIDHVNTGIVTYYAHCNELYVSVGDRVYKGEHIAAMGSTGNSTGPHLHFGVLKYDTWVDPLDYLP